VQRLIEIPDTGLVGVIIERLADAGIDATMTHEHAVWGHYLGGPRPAIIWIADGADLARAREVVGEIVPAPVTATCTACGYDMTGHEGVVRCPECGNPVRVSEPEPAEPAPERLCPHCHETVPGDFEVCWSCGQTLTS
jgi:RNA polymerase subunit RPABC4/transcription elongation factor Spt4